MNRKLINGLLLLTVSATGVGMFTSCKDNEDAIIAEVNDNMSEVAKAITEDLDGKIAGLQSQINTQAAEINTIKGDILTINGDINDLKDDIQTLKDQIADLENEDTDLENRIKDLEDTVAKAEELEKLKERVEALENANLLTEANYDYLKALIERNENYANDLTKYLNDMIINLITSVEIQDVYNPMFGKLNLPIGIQSTLLANYYYESQNNIAFPRPDSPEHEYADKEALNLGDATWNALGVANKQYNMNTVYMGDRGLGDIYVTVNPSTVPADGLKVRLAKSNGEYVLGELTPVKENDYTINFGYTRGERNTNNGFYKITVSAGEGEELAANVETLKIDIESGLKTALKDAIKEHTASDFATLAEKIYQQFNGILPAYALEFSNEIKNDLAWGDVPETEPGFYKYEAPATRAEEGSSLLRYVYSKYAIAATTYRPLSFATDPSDYIPSRRLPANVGHIQSYIQRVFNKINFNLDLGINPDDYKFELDLSNVDFNIEDGTSIKIYLGGIEIKGTEGDNDGKVIGTIPTGTTVELAYNGEGTASVSYKPNALDDLIDKIVEAVNGNGTEGSGFKGELEAAVQKDLISQVDKLVNDLNGQLKDINNTINEKITSIKNQLTDLANGRLGHYANKFIDLYNKVAKKINYILDNPNAYLQVYAAYADGNGDLHHFSTVASDPSVFTKGTGDALKVYMTSYNAELLAPAFKKYVAIVGAEGKDIDVAAANKGGINLNQVVDGSVQVCAINTSNLEAGVVYKVLYTALDFRGNTSSRTYYFTIAK